MLQGVVIAFTSSKCLERVVYLFVASANWMADNNNYCGSAVSIEYLVNPQHSFVCMCVCVCCLVVLLLLFY